MKKRRKSLPKGRKSSHEINELVPWEECFTDSTGKFRLRSKQGDYYFTVLCAERQATKSLSPMSSANFPLVYFEFSKRIGRHPKVLYSDLASKITSSSFERYLLVKGVKPHSCPTWRTPQHWSGRKSHSRFK
jgi:hypothetical protein